MSDATRLTEAERDRIRRYLLGLADAEEAEAVKALLAHEPAWQAALDEEQQRLERLDALETPEHPVGLATRTVTNVRDMQPTRRLASVWIVAISAVAIWLLAVVYLKEGGWSYDHRRGSALANNLKQIGLAFKMYAGESRGELYPPRAPYDDVWMFDLRAVYPEYLSDPKVLVDPGLPDYEEKVEGILAALDADPPDWERATRIAAESITYTGFALKETEDVFVLAQAAKRQSVGSLNDSIQADGRTVHRLRDGIERFFITDINNPGGSTGAQSEIPVLFQGSMTKGRPGAAHVLYLDGHVERFDDAWPAIVESVLTTLRRAPAR